ncbi:nectin-2-like [Emydura macquarii macquarii]|uniref:nectin-2-like n=1 Tax=Emydura macquarii macquarii TaxID=1129001 RepID=UPI00352BA763
MADGGVDRASPLGTRLQQAPFSPSPGFFPSSIPIIFLFHHCRSYKPLPQEAPGGIIGILGGVIAAVLIIGVAVTVFIIYRRQQKSRTETDNDLIDLPPSHKPAPPPKRKQEMKSHLTAEDIQVVHLGNMKQEEEIQKLPQQTPYYDMATSESSPYSEKLPVP